MAPGQKEFRSAAGIPIQCVLAGEVEGRGQEARFPSPSDPKYITTIEGLPDLSLASLIQSKIACGLGNLRRTHRDFADVVELVAVHDLDGSFARFLHKSVRKEFRALVRQARGGKVRQGGPWRATLKTKPRLKKKSTKLGPPP